jgi:uncharacterized lipoprotein YmbA
MKNGFHIQRLFFLAAVTLLLAGCASSPSARFYTLTPLKQEDAKPSSSETATSVSVRIAPVEIPDYLDRPQIATRGGSNELRLAEFDRWAGSLSENIAAVLAENLSTLLGSDRVSVYPRMGAEKADYSVVMRVLRLDCVPGDRVLLKAQWTIFTGQDKKDVATCLKTYTESLSNNMYETMVAAVSHTLEQVSREIAREIIAHK